jgi:hypothetical protein
MSGGKQLREEKLVWLVGTSSDRLSRGVGIFLTVNRHKIDGILS